jgi:hypothetical protein
LVINHANAIDLAEKAFLQANQEHEQEQVKRNLKLQLNMRLIKLGFHKPTTAAKLLSTE